MITEREILARIIAHDHFDRRLWFGACTKAERTQWLVNRYWPQFAHTAEKIILVQQQQKSFKGTL